MTIALRKLNLEAERDWRSIFEFRKPQKSAFGTNEMNLTIQTEIEDDGRWLAQVPQLPGVLAYGATADEASAKVESLALRVLAERLEHAEAKPMNITIVLAAA